MDGDFWGVVYVLCADVIDRLNVLRGRGMASLYSWSCKRWVSYYTFYVLMYYVLLFNFCVCMLRKEKGEKNKMETWLDLLSLLLVFFLNVRNVIIWIWIQIHFSPLMFVLHVIQKLQEWICVAWSLWSWSNSTGSWKWVCPQRLRALWWIKFR